jgi:flagellin
MKLSSAIKRTANVSANVSNALSMLQVQAGSLKSAAAVLDRISELVTLSDDVTKTTADTDNYNTEFKNLVAEIGKLSADTFNGASLFCTGTEGSLTVYLASDSTLNMEITQAKLWDNMGVITDTTKNITDISVSDVTAAVQSLATLMATNGAQSSRVQFAIDSLNANQVNLEASLSRIYDVDVAAETAKLARANILVQSGAAMLTQANASQSIALKLLQ